MTETQVPIGPTATTRTIGEIHSLLRSAMVSGGMTIDVSQVEDADLSFVQLMEVARREATASGQKFCLSAPANDCVKRVLDRAGFLVAARRDDLEFWFQGDLSQ